LLQRTFDSHQPLDCGEWFSFLWQETNQDARGKSMEFQHQRGIPQRFDSISGLPGAILEGKRNTEEK